MLEVLCEVALIYGLAPVRCKFDELSRCRSLQQTCAGIKSLASLHSRWHTPSSLAWERGNSREKGAGKQRQSVNQQCECKIISVSRDHPLSLLLQVLSLWASARDPTDAIQAESGHKCTDCVVRSGFLQTLSEPVGFRKMLGDSAERMVTEQALNM